MQEPILITSRAPRFYTRTHINTQAHALYNCSLLLSLYVKMYVCLNRIYTRTSRASLQQEKGNKLLKLNKQKEKCLLCPKLNAITSQPFIGKKPEFNRKFSTQFIKVEDKTLPPIRKKKCERKNKSCLGSLMEYKCFQHLRQK